MNCTGFDMFYQIPLIYHNMPKNSPQWRYFIFNINHLLVLYCCEVEVLVCSKTVGWLSAKGPLTAFSPAISQTLLITVKFSNWTCIFSNEKYIQKSQKSVHTVFTVELLQFVFRHTFFQRPASITLNVQKSNLCLGKCFQMPVSPSTVALVLSNVILMKEEPTITLADPQLLQNRDNTSQIPPCFSLRRTMLFPL